MSKYAELLESLTCEPTTESLSAHLASLEALDLAGIFAEISREKKKIKGYESVLTSISEKLSAVYLDKLIDSEIEAVRVNGYTVSPRTEFSAKFLDPENGPAKMLELQEFSDLPKLRVDSRSLAKRIKEVIEENGIIDLQDLAETNPELMKLCEVKEFVKLSARTSS